MFCPILDKLGIFNIDSNSGETNKRIHNHWNPYANYNLYDCKNFENIRKLFLPFCHTTKKKKIKKKSPLNYYFIIF